MQRSVLRQPLSFRVASAAVDVAFGIDLAGATPAAYACLALAGKGTPLWRRRHLAERRHSAYCPAAARGTGAESLVQKRLRGDVHGRSHGR